MTVYINTLYFNFLLKSYSFVRKFGVRDEAAVVTPHSTILHGLIKIYCVVVVFCLKLISIICFGLNGKVFQLSRVWCSDLAAGLGQIYRQQNTMILERRVSTIYPVPHTGHCIYTEQRTHCQRNIYLFLFTPSSQSWLEI